jgi:hypothetical protein
MRPTAPPEPIADDAPPDDAAEIETESRGESSEDTPQAPGKKLKKKSVRAVRRKVAEPGKKLPRNIHLSEDIYDRLKIYAHQRKTSVAETVAWVLDQNLPRWEIKRAS